MPQGLSPLDALVSFSIVLRFASHLVATDFRSKNPRRSVQKNYGLSSKKVGNTILPPDPTDFELAGTCEETRNI